MLIKNKQSVAVLFAREDSVYKTIEGCDVWDVKRDAMTFVGTEPVIAHPPCKRWSPINGVVLARYPDKATEFAWGNDGGTFEFALNAVRKNGGVLEHPAQSRAFKHFGLNKPGKSPDSFGGFVFEVRQCDWGHRAEKKTWLYVVGIHPDELPVFPKPQKATALISRMPDSRQIELMGKAERERTPKEFALWLVTLAKQCEPNMKTKKPLNRALVLSQETL